MFKGLGNLANLAGMLKQAQSLGGRLQELTERMQTEQVTGTAAGGLVSVTATGGGVIVSVAVDPQLLERNDREMLQDLLTAAINDALAKAKHLNAEAMSELTGGLDLPGLDGLLGKPQA